jgi:predicted GNAT family acetyltransferase
MIRFFEELSLNAWPTIQTLNYDGWILRFAEGYTKRANSVNPLYSSSENIDQKILECETFYTAKKLSSIFKLTPAASPNNLDNVLEQKGYAAIDHTSVRVLDLADLRAPSIHTVHVSLDVTDEWLDHYCRLSGTQPNHRTTMKRMILNIVPQTCFMTLMIDGTVVSCGFGVVERDYIGLYDIVTDASCRNRGYGERLVLQLLRWGKETGAQHAYLQVAANNKPAIKLYEKVGFTEIYQYWYRVKKNG